MDKYAKVQKMKFTWTNYFTDSEYYRLLKYSADTEYRMDTRYSHSHRLLCSRAQGDLVAPQ